ncbi:MAG: cytochrome c [Nitrospira sp.]|nr:cytochrome c [Nitrospira sp.]
MRPSSCDISPHRQGTGAAFTAGLGFAAVLLAGSLLWAGPQDRPKAAGRPHDAEQGRTIFNGKGLCSTCHGIDGHRDRLPPQLSAHIRENIERLTPAPPDLRRVDTLTSTTDKERFEIIRHGHLRTAMYPLSQATLSDEDIRALLPYLASIRGTLSRTVPTPEPVSPLRGDAAQGRQLFHELGGCAICHGIEGHLDRRPPISKDLAQRLDALPAPPADLRNPAALKAENDEDRFLSIKRGHPGTAMYPKTLLRDEDIRDLVAYLATLRDGGR